MVELKKAFVSTLIGLWVLLGVAGFTRGADGPPEGQGPPPALVRVGVARHETLQARWDAVGRLSQVQYAVVAAEQPGRVMQVPVDEGDGVTAGQTVLAKIDDVWAKLAVAAAEAHVTQGHAIVAETKAQFDLAERNRHSLEELLKASSAKPKEVADARNEEEAAKARLDRAKADLLIAQADLDLREVQLARLSVLAPFDGVVVKKNVEVGQWVKQGDPVMEVISSGRIDAVIDAPEAVVNQIDAGHEVEVIVEPLSLELIGRVVAINPMGSNAARTYRVKIRLDDPESRLKPGMSVIAKVPTGKSVEVLTVPRDAVYRTANGTEIWADVNSLATPIPVKVLFSQGDRYAVQPTAQPPAGALAGDLRVVTEGSERLFPGRPLSIIESRTE